METFVQILQPTPYTFYLILPLVIFFLLFRFFRKPFPPGPIGWPIIGNMMMMDQLTHHGLANLAKKYGGFFHLRMGFVNMMIVSSPDIARQVLQVQDKICSNRPATVAIRYLTYDRADMSFAHYGPFWRQVRKICVMKLFSRKRAESWDSVRDKVDAMVRLTATSSGTALNIGELVFGLTQDIIYRAAFGSVSDGKEEFIRILQEFSNSKLLGAFNIGDFIPWLCFIDPAGLNNRLHKARASLDKFIDKIIDEHVEKRNGSNGVDVDMVDELLAFYGEGEGETATKVNESEDVQNAVKLSRNNIKAIIMDIMFGGTETVASGIEWALSELMHSPADLKRVQQELLDVVGLNRQVEETDFDKLTYLKCCLKETLRLHPPIPLLLHETAKATEIAGYQVPAKSRIIINIWAIGRDPNSWEDAQLFKPERFLEKGAPDFRPNNFEFIPFGSGRRSCPGTSLGLYSLEVAVAHLLHCFTWELPDGMKSSQLDTGDVFGLAAPRASRLVAIPTTRLLC